MEVATIGKWNLVVSSAKKLETLSVGIVLLAEQRGEKAIDILRYWVVGIVGDSNQKFKKIVAFLDSN